MDFERLKTDPQFQEIFLDLLTDRVAVKKYPDYLEREQERFTLELKDENVPFSEKDRMYINFKTSLRELKSVDEIKQFCAAVDVEFPSNDEVVEIERATLENYNRMHEIDFADENKKPN